MRKSLKLMGMAAMVLLLAVSCKKEKQDEGRKTVFTAGIEQGTGKTYVHDDGSQYGLYWSDGDAIKVNGVECALTSGAGKTSGTFEGDVEEKEKYYAVYPSSAGFAGTTATFNIPETQAFADGTFASQTAPMVAESGSEKSFTFTNLCGILDIRLYGTDVTVNKVVLTATGASIAGEYTYDFTNSEAGLVQAGAKGDGNNTITMDGCNKVIGATESAPTSFVFVLPPAELAQLQIDVYANDGVTPALTKTIDGLNITAGQAYCNTTPYKVEAEPVAYQGLCFTAEEAGATVKLVEKSLYGKMNLREVSLTPGLQYSSDGTNWCDYTIGKDITLNNEGDKVYFRRESKANTFSTPTTGNFMQFVTNVNDEKQIVTDDEKKIAASGNIMSLLDPDCEVTEFDSQDGFACFYMLFNGCTSLTTAPELPATTLAQYCYIGMFNGCISLTTAPALPATTLAQYCYADMFEGCTSLTKAPALPATTLAEYCYYSMFEGCISLTTAPALPATTLAGYCYYNMFTGCTSLTTAPALPVTALAATCYRSMFEGCTSLTTAPALPVMTLANYCSESMFAGCTSLTAAPALPATTLAKSCYYQMFYGCTSLIAAPELKATDLVEFCYSYMFKNCNKLNSIKVHFTEWEYNTTTGWVDGVSTTGTFYCPSNLEELYGSYYIPTGWSVVTF